MKLPYSIGLDIGTNSIGWAVIDENCNLMRYKHQNMSGSHLFSEAQKADKRRRFRSTRRRMARRSRRIAQLQMLLDNLVSQKDPAFYRRLKESRLHLEDRADDTIGNILFNDHEFTDRDYRAQYPTIYHLRKDLIESSDKRDIRLIYLAMHHIIKYRGHFLYEGQQFTPGSDNDSVVESGLRELDAQLGNGFAIYSKQIADILTRTNSTPSSKASEIKSLISEHPRRDTFGELVRLMAGLSAKVSKLGDVDYDETKFSLADTNYENEKRDKLVNAFGDDFAMIEATESIFKWSLLQSVLKDKQFISQAMVESYDEYAIDLKSLKKLFRDHKSLKEYTGFFRKPGATYNDYEDRGKVKIDDLVRTIKKAFENSPAALASREYKRFEERAALGTFLQKQRIRANGAIPHQIHRNELVAIIDNQSAHYPELLDIKDKLVSILTFRIPYYVGPLKTGGEFAWAVKIPGVDQTIYPWNFDHVIDTDNSAQEFIEKMRNLCTYLPNETVLPKSSLLYAEFELRNELKSVRVNDEQLSIDIQNRLLNELFAKQKSVSHAALKKWLKTNGLYDNAVISGTQKEAAFASSLTALIDLELIGIDTDAYRHEAEQIIEWATLFEDRKILQRKLATLSNILSPEQQKQCLKLRYTGWGRLSRKLLDGLRLECRYGNCTVMDIMRTVYDAHFMKVIDSDDYPFKDQIAEIQHEAWGGKTQITYNDIHALAGSPGIKRGIWRSIKIVNEITELMGYAPKSINIEMARQENVKKRTDSRQKQLLKLYDALIGLADDYNRTRARDIKKAISGQNDQVLRSERFYLYFLQNGKCAYSGNDIDVDRLSEYDVDHIIPRALLKDDSISNKVLVEQGYNREKSSDYPLRPEIISKMRGLWDMWHKSGLMDDTKFRRLVRQRDFSDAEVAGFINRQLVETRQITKHVARLLGEQFRDNKTQIRTIRASVASEYRHVYNFPKSRELNDLHHAKDAYLVAVIGEFMARRYPRMDKASLYGAYLQHKKKRTSHLHPIFVVAEMARDTINSSTGEYRWLANDMLANIERTMGYNDVLVTKMTKQNTGEFYNQNADPKGRGRIPIEKGFAPEKYGGYSNEICAYCVAVEWYEGKRIKRQLVKLPIPIALRVKDDASALQDYFSTLLGQQAFSRILIPKVPLNQKILRNGALQYIASDNEVHNAVQFILPLSIQRELIPILGQRSTKPLTAAQLKIVDGFFDIYLNKLENHYSMYASEAAKIRSSGNAYFLLTPEEKIDAIKKLLVLTSTGAGEPDLSKPIQLNLTQRFGRKGSQTIHVDNVVFIYESITGLRKRLVAGKDL